MTGIWGESRAGGYFGRALAKAGWSGILIRGQAEGHACLWASNGEAGLLPL